MQRCLLLSLCFFLVGAVLPCAAQTTVPRYAKFEASWTFPAQTGNPYDPAQNDVMVVFHGPGGSATHVPAFWDGDRWRVRFAPAAVGAYTFTVLRDGKPTVPADLTPRAFRCVPSTSAGFVRRSPADPQRFMLDSGAPFFPFGTDRAWGGGGVLDYPQAFAVMHQNGLNWARVWMNAWDEKNLEWDADKTKSPPIGQYDLAVARKWDTIVDAADRSGIYIQMTVQHHGEYTAHTDPNWQDNPFNVANGGFLAHPDDFFTNPEAKRLTRNKLRYIVARWGYSTHLMAFELFNEVQNITEADSHFADVVEWHREMAAYLRSIDPDHHLITTSNSPPDDPLAHIGLDYDQVHAYVPDIISYFATYDLSGVSVPLFWGEWGASGQQTQPFLHDGLWAGLMVPAAGAPQYWYWDTIEHDNWWPTFRAATAYVAASRMASALHLGRLRPDILAASGRAPLTFAPGMGWGTTKTFDVTVSPDGTVTGLGGVSSFIQGNGHRDMMPRPVVFHLQCAQACQFQLLVASVAKSGAHPQISVDGVLQTEKDYPAAASDHDANDTLSVALSPGTHAVSVFNTGPDWFTVGHIAITDYAPAIGALAKGNAHTAFFWAYARDRAATAPVSATLALPGLAPGRYAVTLWDTQTGTPIAGRMEKDAVGGSLTIPLPKFTGDIAGWAVPATALGMNAQAIPQGRKVPGGLRARHPLQTRSL